jgi:hypothetical protein
MTKRFSVLVFLVVPLLSIAARADDAAPIPNSSAAASKSPTALR